MRDVSYSVLGSPWDWHDDDLKGRFLRTDRIFTFDQGLVERQDGNLVVTHKGIRGDTDKVMRDVHAL